MLASWCLRHAGCRFMLHIAWQGTGSPFAHSPAHTQTTNTPPPRPAVLTWQHSLVAHGALSPQVVMVAVVQGDMVPQPCRGQPRQATPGAAAPTPHPATCC
jgi:hypothetical protein